MSSTKIAYSFEFYGEKSSSSLCHLLVLFVRDFPTFSRKFRFWQIAEKYLWRQIRRHLSMRETEHKRNQLISIQMSHPSALELDGHLHFSAQIDAMQILANFSLATNGFEECCFLVVVLPAQWQDEIFFTIHWEQFNEKKFHLSFDVFATKWQTEVRRWRVQHSHRVCQRIT